MRKNINQQIDERAVAYSEPDGHSRCVISLKAVTSIARTEKVSIRDVEIAALENGVVPWRYIRNIGTIGLDGQINLMKSSVAVVGAGGLGGTIIELLARQGIGHITVIDNDRFAEQNLNRQIMSTERNLGEYKAVMAAKRVAQINAAVTVTVSLERITKGNASTLLKGATVVVDGLDNLPSRFVVESACRKLRIPFIHGTIAGFCGQLTTIFPEDAGLGCIYGSAKRFPEKGVEVKIGNPSATPAIVAAWQVQEVVKVITGIGKPLRNCLLLLDMMEGTVDRIEFNR